MITFQISDRKEQLVSGQKNSKPTVFLSATRMGPSFGLDLNI